MDPQRFDALARTLGSAASRRGALAAFVAGLASPLLAGPEAAAGRGRGKGRSSRKRHARDRARRHDRATKDDGGQRPAADAASEERAPARKGHRTNGNGKSKGKAGKGKHQRRRETRNARAQATTACFTGSNCAPAPGKNLSKCDYFHSTTLRNARCAGCNLGGANLREADATGADLSRVNFDKACLVDTNLRGATLAGANTGTARFCRTVMPDGSRNDRDCATGTECCPTCDAGHPCPTGQVCCAGTCVPGNCCADAQCLDPAKPVCLDHTCAPCKTDKQCGAGKRCCVGQCKVGVCCTASDCATRPCRSKACTNNQCVYALLDGAPCDDGNPCTVGDACRNGVCAGTAKDCSAQADACNDGVCRPSDGQCVKKPKADGTACGASAECRTGVCEETCRVVGVTCTPTANQCCEGANCEVLTTGCYAGGVPHDPRCCTATGETCSHDCDCCGLSFCEGTCCSHSTGSCQAATDCCQNVFNKQDCLNGKCCALDDEPCDEEGQCCRGICDLEDGRCKGCLGLGRACDPASNQCCQSGGPTECDEPEFGADPVCCRPRGGACQANGDCCNGVACRGGRCCSGVHEVCAADDECCPGFECRAGRTEPNTKRCRPATCLESGETCGAGLRGCCPDGVATCTTNGSTTSCCARNGSACEQIPGQGSPCCSDIDVCDQELHASPVCCQEDFATIQFGIRSCEQNGECCSGFCNQFHGTCCRTEGQPCDESGPFPTPFGGCCPYLGLQCSGNGGPGQCIPCRKAGQTCGPNAPCCLGVECINGTCDLGGACHTGIACQEDSVCCPGFTCDADRGSCFRVCAARGESCLAGFACCTGLTCGEPDFTCK